MTLFHKFCHVSFPGEIDVSPVKLVPFFNWTPCFLLLKTSTKLMFYKLTFGTPDTHHMQLLRDVFKLVQIGPKSGQKNCCI